MKKSIVLAACITAATSGAIFAQDSAPSVDNRIQQLETTLRQVLADLEQLKAEREAVFEELESGKTSARFKLLVAISESGSVVP